MMRSAVLILGVFLSGCGSSNQARFLIDPPAAETKIAVRVATIEVREVQLPAYAAAVDIAQQDADGAVRNLSGTLWADDPVRGITSALARSLDATTTATAASSPWPLKDPAQAEIEVRIETMLAESSGQFRLSGQFAVTSLDGVVRDHIRRFDITAPLTGDGPAGIAQASGVVIARLAAEIAADLKR